MHYGGLVGEGGIMGGFVLFGFVDIVLMEYCLSRLVEEGRVVCAYTTPRYVDVGQGWTGVVGAKVGDGVIMWAFELG